jgi:hypothetical protein
MLLQYFKLLTEYTLTYCKRCCDFARYLQNDNERDWLYLVSLLSYSII